jgi:hypothetical protein
MITTEIPRQQWIKFFDDFSKKHEGWIVTMEVLGQDLGDQEQTATMKLIGVSADVKDRESRVEIIAGDRPDAHLTRIINSPKRVWLKQPEEVGHESIEVESEEGISTLLRFRHILPEEVERQLPEKAFGT